ncbi:MAG: hypothetical protein CM15mP13_2400 [Pseudomonadota bacterium]|nr:MAG: hypothetical protein CM15mP13_2400 [Pseudomonadota bacterium]
MICKSIQGILINAGLLPYLVSIRDALIGSKNSICRVTYFKYF